MSTENNCQECLGLGSYGIIISEVGSTICRKIFTKERAMSMIREAFIIKKLSHINGITEMIQLDHPTLSDTRIINSIRGTVDQVAWGVIVMKRYNITLNQWLRYNPPYSVRLQIVKQICNIIVDVHSAGIIHADLKLENIMLNDSGEVRIIDWGLSSFKDYARINGTTRAYRPRKIVQNYCHDIYSLGVLIIQLLLGSLLVNTLEYTSCIRMLDVAVSDLHLRKLLSRMIHPECKIRPSIYEVASVFDIPISIRAPDLIEKSIKFNISPKYGLIKMEYPSYFKDFLMKYPQSYNTIIAILGAIYQCDDPELLIQRINYLDFIRFIEFI